MMGWLNRSRATSDERAIEVGRPTLQFTDAQPRNDLQSLGQLTPSARPATAKDGSKAFDEERPKTSGAPSRQKTRPNLPQTPASFNLYPSAATHGNSSKTNLAINVDEGAAIGMALGSPTHPPPRPAQQNYNRSPLLNSEALAHDENLYDHDATKNKSGKWKKLGGIFKAKNAFGQPLQHNSPFYSLTNQYAASVSPTEERKPAPTETWPLPQPPVGMPTKAQKLTGQLDNNNKSVSSLAKPSMDSSQRSNLPGVNFGGPKRSLESYDDHNAAIRNFESSAMFGKGASSALPSLDVDIPDSQMERYSVMFGSLLGGSSSNLLARRSRMLEKLRNISDEDETPNAKNDGTELHSDIPGLPKGPKDLSHLAPQPHPPRRATSPSQQSPNLNLFPKHDNLGKNGRRSPIPRSFTAPARLSPMQETFELEKPKTKDQSQPDVDFVSSPSQTNSATTHSQKYSSDSSFLSPTSTRDSADEEDILFNVKPLQPWGEYEEQQWELGSSENLVKPFPLNMTLKQRSNLGPKSPEWEMFKSKQSHIKEAEVKPLRIKSQDSHEETLAALERPPPQGQDLPPLKATKAAVDRLMSPPPSANRVKLDEKIAKLDRDIAKLAKDRIPSLAPDQAAFSVTSDAVSDAVRKLNEPLTRSISQKKATGTEFEGPSIPRSDSVAAQQETYIPKLKVRNRSNTITQSDAPSQAPASSTTTTTTSRSTTSQSQPQSSSPPSSRLPRRVASRPAMTDNAITTLASDLDALEHQIESRAVRAMKKRAAGGKASSPPEPVISPPASLSDFPAPVSAPKPTLSGTVSSATSSPRPIVQPTRSATDDPSSKRGESRAVRAARKQAAELQKAKSMESLHAAAAAGPDSPLPSLPPAAADTEQLHEAQSVTPSPQPEVQLARQVSLSKRPKQLLIPISSSGSKARPTAVENSRGGVHVDQTVLRDGERFHEGMRVGTPTLIVGPDGIGIGDQGSFGKGRGHRYERSVGVVIESA